MLPWLVIASCSAKPPATPARGAAATDLVFTGMCDASGAVALSDALFAVADDEDNVLRIYDANRGGPAVAASQTLAPLSLELASAGRTKPAKRARELDIEGATRIGNVALWITSHGRNSSGKQRPERLVFLGTTAPAGATGIELVGEPYVHLLDDLSSDARLSAFDIAAAAARPPTEPGGLNIEGLTERPDGGVYIGFRNPIPGGKALLVPLLNPLAILHGDRARFGDPVLLDLGGLGVRSLSWWRGRYLIAAGDFADRRGSRLLLWDGHTAPEVIAGVDLADFNPEAFFTPEASDRILLLSDDGADMIGGVACKRLTDDSRKRFRGRWIAPPHPPIGSGPAGSQASGNVDARAGGRRR